MKIVPRILSFLLILQLLALSSVPPVRFEFSVQKGQGQLKPAKETHDNSGFLGQFSGFNKDEQTEIAEDDTENVESFHGLACAFGQTGTAARQSIHRSIHFYDRPQVFVKTSLFLLFHCWKIDMVEA